MTKKITNLLLFFLGVCLCISWNTYGQVPPNDLEGEALKTWLKANYYDDLHNELTYSTARMYLYNYIDNENNTITDVYAGYEKAWTYGGTGTNPAPLNCEHTIPQSLFSSAYPMQSDLHHLYPVYSSWNSTRNNNPFAEINDAQTTKWMIGNASQATKPTNNIDAYSEYSAGKFEPREVHKGNLARSMFYFYTMYPSQAGDIALVADPDMLYQWHLNDPVDATELQRNAAIETYQGTKNPYIEMPELVARAWEVSLPTTDTTTTDTTTLAGFASNLLISEYIEGTSYNKSIEIANFTGETVDLSVYSLRKNVNGGSNWSGDFTLSGSLVHGDVFVVSHPSAATVLQNETDIAVSGLNFNGNDPIGLFQNDVLIDIVGIFGGGSAYFAKDITLVRNANIVAPNTAYTDTEWTIFGTNTFSNIGSHEMLLEVEDTTTTEPTDTTAVAFGTELIISEYFEGSSYNKAVELTNMTNETVDLESYTLHKQTNGSGSWSSGLDLSGEILAGESFVIALNSAAPQLLDLADFISNNTALNFNGNDPIALAKDGTLIDIVGDFGAGKNTFFGKDKTLVRKASINSPNSAFDENEWDSYPKNTIDYLGTHIFGSAKNIKKPNALQTVQLYPNPFDNYVTLSYELIHQNENISIRLFDINGRLVEILKDEKNLFAGKYQQIIATEELSKGIYFIQILTSNGMSAKRLVKQ
ncbi:MAG: endonuclease [Chitinophagales bacterium]